MILTNDKIKYHYQDNAERGAARNNGIRKAIGEFIVFLDSDVEMKPEYLGILYEGIHKHPGYNFYAAKYTYLADGKVRNSSTSLLAEGEYKLDLVLKGNPFSCNFCIRKDNQNLILFKETKTFAVPEDWIFLVENLRNNAIFLFDGIGLSMHQHDNRSMQRNQPIVNQRLAATKALISENAFSEGEIKTLWGYSYYFCSIHAYIDNKRSQSLQYISKSIKILGLNYLFLRAFCKYIVGINFLKLLK